VDMGEVILNIHLVVVKPKAKGGKEGTLFGIKGKKNWKLSFDGLKLIGAET